MGDEKARVALALLIGAFCCIDCCMVVDHYCDPHFVVVDRDHPHFVDCWFYCGDQGRKDRENKILRPRYYYYCYYSDVCLWML